MSNTRLVFKCQWIILTLLRSGIVSRTPYEVEVTKHRSSTILCIDNYDDDNHDYSSSASIKTASDRYLYNNTSKMRLKYS